MASTLSGDALARLHLSQAEALWREDRVGLAREALSAALRAGVHPGGIFDFQRMVEAEAGVRSDAVSIRCLEHLVIEADPGRWGHAWNSIIETIERSCLDVSVVLDVRWGRHVRVTVFPSDDWVEFMHARYGYSTARIPCHKVCLPPSACWPLSQLRRACLHEVAHAAVDSISRELAPRWLTEGIAMWLEGGLDTLETRQVRLWARHDHRMTLADVDANLGSLYVDLSSREALAYYAYAGRFVEQMANARGSAGIREVLTRIGKGESADRAVRSTYGAAVGRLERDWAQRA